MYRNIIVGVDLSPSGMGLAAGSREALGLAEALAHNNAKARVTLLHATRDDAYFDVTQESQVWLLRDGFSQQGRAALDDACRVLTEKEVAAQVEVVEERAWKALCDAARRQSGSVIIVAKRDHGDFDFDDRRFGAVAVKLLRQCPAAIWTVQPGQQGAPKTILAATDLTADVGARVLAHAGGLSAALEADLHVVHACHPSWLTMLAGRPDAELERLEHRARDWIRERLPPQLTGAKIHIKRGTPAAVIGQVSEEVGADLVVMGTVSRTGITGALIGNSAERVVGTLPRSLLTIKPVGA